MNEPKFNNIQEQRQWEYENLSKEELEKRGWAILVDTPDEFGINCLCRYCIHFHGKEKGSCKAYPNGIPDKFKIGRETHISIEENQVGDFVWTHYNDTAL